MRLLLLATSTLLTLTACYDPETADADEDGLVDAEEDRLGLDKDAADTDGDGLNDGDEVNLGLDPKAADTDGDGLRDGDEVANGLDGLVGDTDRDEVGDLEEVEGGSDGTSCTSVPEGYWPNCLEKAEEDGLEGEGWRVDDVMEDWSADDQFGEEISLYQFYGNVVLLDFSAGWCGPCNSAAPGQEEVYQEYRDQGFVILHVMVDDNSYDGYVTDDNFAEDWAEEHDLTFPVVVDTSRGGYSEAYYNLYLEGYIEGVPTFAILDRELRFIDTWSGENESRMLSNIEDLL